MKRENYDMWDEGVHNDGYLSMDIGGYKHKYEGFYKKSTY